MFLSWGNVWEYWRKRTEKINVVIDTLLILHKSEQSGRLKCGVSSK